MEMEFLHNQKGKICKIFKNRFIFSRYNNAPTLIQFHYKGGKPTSKSFQCTDNKFSSTDEIKTCHYIGYSDKRLNVSDFNKFIDPTFVWLNGKPVHFDDLEDGAEVNYDAVFLSEVGFQAILVWQGLKPHSIPVLQSDEVILSQNYLKVPIHEISFKDGKSYISVMIEEEMKKIPFSFSKVLVNGNKFSSETEFYGAFLTSTLLLANICKLFNFFSSQEKPAYNYYCSCITSDYFISCSETSLEAGNVYVFMNDDMIPCKTASFIFFDVKFKQNQINKLFELRFEINGKDYLFKRSTYKGEELEVKEGVGHIYVCGNDCYILVTEITLHQEQFLLNNRTQIGEEDTSLKTEQSCNSKLQTNEKLVGKKHHHSIRDKNTVDHEENLKSLKDELISENNSFHGPAKSDNVIKKNKNSQIESILSNSTSNLDNTERINSMRNKVNDHCPSPYKVRLENGLEIGSGLIYQTKVEDGQSQVKFPVNTTCLIMNKLAVLVRNFTNEFFLFYSQNNQVSYCKVFSVLQPVFTSGYPINISSVMTPCPLYFDALILSPNNHLSTVLLWVGKKPKYGNFGGNLFYFEVLAVVIETHPNLVIVARINDSINSFVLFKEAENYFFDANGLPCKCIAKGTVLLINIAKRFPDYKWDVVYAVVCNYEFKVRHQIAIEELLFGAESPVDKKNLILLKGSLQSSKSTISENVKVNEFSDECRKITRNSSFPLGSCTPDAYHSNESKTEMETSLLEHIDCHWFIETARCVVLMTEKHTIIMSKENICLQPERRQIKIPSALLMEGHVQVYALKLAHAVQHGVFTITHIGMVAFQGLQEPLREEIESIMDKNMKIYSVHIDLDSHNHSTANMHDDKNFSLQIEEELTLDVIQENCGGTVTGDFDTTRNDKVSKKRKNKIKLNRISSFDKKPAYTYFVQGVVHHFNGSEGLLAVNVTTLNLDDPQNPMLLCYFNKGVAYIMQKGKQIEDDTFFAKTLQEHINEKVIYRAEIYPCEKQVIFNLEINFCVALLWRKHAPHGALIKCFYPPLHSFLSTHNSEMKESIVGSSKTVSLPPNPSTCEVSKSSENRSRSNMFYFAEGKVTNFTGNEGILCVPSHYLNMTETEMPTVFCFFNKAVVYLQTQKGKQIKDNNFIQTFRQQIRDEVFYRAAVYHCESRILLNTEVNYCVSLLWRKDVPEDIFFRRILLPRYSNVLCKKAKSAAYSENFQIEIKASSIIGKAETLASLIEYNKSEKDTYLSVLTTSKEKDVHKNLEEDRSTQEKSDADRALRDSEPFIPITKRLPGDKRPSLPGVIIELKENRGKLRSPFQTVLSFKREKCFIYGINLHLFSLKKILQLGYRVEFETDSSGAIDEVWIGGGPQETLKDNYEKILSWCNTFGVQKEAKLKLLQECDWIPSSCDPITVIDTSCPIVTLE